MDTVIITGASSGLGREYFKAAVKLLPDCEYWLVARRREKLEETAKLAQNAKVKIVECDLDSKSGLESFFALLASEKPAVKAFINNAGFGKLGNVAELDPFVQRDMVSLNCGSLTCLCADTVKYMQKGSCIVNVSSIASFVPNPRMTVYSSTKAYVTAFSKGLREELKPQGINVLAVCPGPMHTEFMEVAHITNENSKTFRTLPYCNAEEVAYKSLKRAIKGKAFYTNKGLYKFYRVLAKLAPHNIMMKFAKC
ncbi:MAG: SDR family NAD(P)-dependent oxidoreductase [Clostridia bacterium]|nr:SDR family NAD(P)-dependent oxidoreductase [Clostridia bacterium]MBR5745707.1 SDR family NAD(P)-dependent oxidoreductase [Clostridia bacterium]